MTYPDIDLLHYLACYDPAPQTIAEAAYHAPAIADLEAGLLRLTSDLFLEPLPAGRGGDIPSTRLLVFRGKDLSVVVRVVRAWPNSRLDGRIATRRCRVAVLLWLGYGETAVLGSVYDDRFHCDPVPTGPARLLFLGESSDGKWKARTEWVTL
jgi:hypothetical protein